MAAVHAWRHMKTHLFAFCICVASVALFSLQHMIFTLVQQEGDINFILIYVADFILLKLSFREFGIVTVSNKALQMEKGAMRVMLPGLDERFL